MNQFRATASAYIQASANRVYDVLADYRKGHRLILPEPYFVSLEVEQGGFGAGTIINFKMRIAGEIRSFRASVSEPQAGRVLVETSLEEGGPTTTFEVSPVDDGQRSEVRITTEGRVTRKGLLGSLERTMTQMYLKRIYKKELKSLAKYLQGQQPA